MSLKIRHTAAAPVHTHPVSQGVGRSRNVTKDPGEQLISCSSQVERHGDLRRQYCGALFAIVLLLGACGKPVARPASNPTTSTATTTSNNNAVIKAKSHRVLQDAIKAGGPGCSAAAGSKGTVVWTGALGVADTATGAEITPDTVFDIGSVSKQFTATRSCCLPTRES